MTPRSFTVFLDEDVSSTTATTAKTITTTTTRTSTSISRPCLKASASSPAILSTSTFGSTAPTDKENYDPLTGERAMAIGGLVSGKGVKRKGSVSSGSGSGSGTGGSILVTKTVEVNIKENGIVLKEKEVYVLKEKVLKEKDGGKEPVSKKRRSSVSSVSSAGSVSSTKTKGTKTKKASGVTSSGKKATSTRKSSRSRTRASPVPSMPRVDEEAEIETTVERLSQEQIDARCYDLTVSPLADVSEAYGSGVGALLSIVESPSSDEECVFNFVKEPSTEPEIRDYDYFALSHSGSAATLRGSSPLPPSSNSSASSVSEPKQFSTPERKKIYSAFTFTSPSPSSERFAQVKREASVPKLELS